MAEIENQGTQNPTEVTQSENLEAVTTDNDNSTTEGNGQEGQSLNQKLEALGLTREDYFKLKGKEDSLESGESREESRQQVTVSDAERMARIELKAEGITDVDDIAAVMDAAKGLGIDPVEAAQKPFVQAMLEANAKAREVQAATPGSSTRSGQTSAKDTTEYWLKKGELPPKENKALRREVMHKMNESRTRKQMFNN